jgi:hypothetical protein
MRRRDTPQFKAISADTPSSGGSKLKSLIQGVTDLADITPGTLAPWNNPQFWDHLAIAITEPDGQTATLVDVGTNLADPMLAWARDSGLIDVALPNSVDVVVPFTINSCGPALSLIQSVIEPGLLPLRRVIPMANEWLGSFDDRRNDKTLDAIAEIGQTHGPGLIKIPRCFCDLLRISEDGRFTLEDLMSAPSTIASYNTIAEATGMFVFKAARELRAFKTWEAACRAAFLHAGLLAPPPPPALSNMDTDNQCEESAID